MYAGVQTGAATPTLTGGYPNAAFAPGTNHPPHVTPGSETWTPEQVWHFLRDHGFDEQICSSFLTRRIDGKQFARLGLLDLVPPLFQGDALVRDRLFALIQQLAQGIVPYPPMMAQMMPVPMMPVPMMPQMMPQMQPQGPLFQVAPIPDEFSERTSWGHLFISRTRGHYVPNMMSWRYLGIPVVAAVIVVVVIINALTSKSVIMVIIPIIFAVIFLGFMLKRVMGIYTFWFESQKFRAKNIFSQPFEVLGSDIDAIYVCEMKSTKKHQTYLLGYKIRLRLKNSALRHGEHLDVEMPIVMADRALLMARALAGLLGAPYSDGIH